jgi:cellulose biosynthesis protein BcsQ
VRRIIVPNYKGGAGKSTVTEALRAGLGEEAQVVDLDPQQTMAKVAAVTGRHAPVAPEEAESRFIIYDCPPYKSPAIKPYLELADVIVVPVCIGVPDLIATKALIDDLREMGIQHKVIIVVNYQHP